MHDSMSNPVKLFYFLLDKSSSGIFVENREEIRKPLMLNVGA